MEICGCYGAVNIDEKCHLFFEVNLHDVNISKNEPEGKQMYVHNQLTPPPPMIYEHITKQILYEVNGMYRK